MDKKIVRDINLRNKHHDVVVKFYMSKAHDRISLMFFVKVLIRFGFPKNDNRNESKVDKQQLVLSSDKWIILLFFSIISRTGIRKSTIPYPLHNYFRSVDKKFK